MNALLTIQEVADLEGVSYKAINMRIQRSVIEAIKKPMSGRNGYQYAINIDQLSEKAKRRYYKQLAGAVGADEVTLQGETKVNKYDGLEMTGLTAEQRADIAFWKTAVEGWRAFIANYPGGKTEMTAAFVDSFNQTHDRKITERTLRRKWQAMKEYGEVALADLRGQSKRKDSCKIADVPYAVFLQWWLDEAQPTVSHIYRLLNQWLALEIDKEKLPVELLPLPSESTFYRATQKLPVRIIKYFRSGLKEYEDECLGFIIRTYEDMDANEVWSADYHTLDCFVRDDYTGKVYRPHLMAWLDVRSRKVLSVTLCDSANSDGTVIGFRKAVRKYGLPNTVYLDNGREFLVHDFGGRGKRKTDKNANYGATILDRLGIVMHNAKVKNAKAKVIERAFRTLTEEFSRLVITCTGGSPDKRPDRLDGIIKDGTAIPLLSEIRASLEAYIEGWYNENPSNAEGLRGLSPNQCYAENLICKRVAAEADLDLLLLRSERLQQVKRNGVKLNMAGTELWFYSEELALTHMGKSVYVRYNPEDLRKVHIYDEREVKIGEAGIVEKCGYDFTGEVTKERIKETARRNKKLTQSVTGFMDGLTSTYQAPDALEALTEVSLMAAANSDVVIAPQVIMPVTFGQAVAESVPVVFGQAVSEGKAEQDSGEGVVIDFSLMTANARLRRASGRMGQ